ncbi:MAG: hypothetical protein HN341_18100 [Verrucomicrobia bacterium]|nr:hypothetical protein [Verrucomicrobiota bacterium]
MSGLAIGPLLGGFLGRTFGLRVPFLVMGLGQLESVSAVPGLILFALPLARGPAEPEPAFLLAPRSAPHPKTSTATPAEVPPAAS